MGHYIRGDVVIAAVTFGQQGMAKTRPAVVIGTGERGEVYLCPVSSKPSTDGPSVPISLDDFSEGGLDLFGESYVLTSRVFVILSGGVIGKRGRLTVESCRCIIMTVPPSMMPGFSRKKGTGSPGPLR
jgi:mRNA interferase MazF